MDAGVLKSFLFELYDIAVYLYYILKFIFYFSGIIFFIKYIKKK